MNVSYFITKTRALLRGFMHSRDCAAFRQENPLLKIPHNASAKQTMTEGCCITFKSTSIAALGFANRVTPPTLHLIHLIAIRALNVWRAPCWVIRPRLAPIAVILAVGRVKSSVILIITDYQTADPKHVWGSGK